ncbi:MAG: hypothetical protein II498_02170, partial [Ruminococcus sp.]|nr:hypothetical protein [Ruminococcus sp.]
ADRIFCNLFIRKPSFLFCCFGSRRGLFLLFPVNCFLRVNQIKDGMAVEVESNGFPVYIESAVLELLACIIVEKTLTEFEQQMEVFIASQLGLAR